MTKLTQQEIEREQEAFEKWFLGFHGFNNSNDFLSDKNRYRNDLTNTYWYPWLARAELEKNIKLKFLPLTDKQLMVLSYIEKYINENGYSPKLKEVKSALNFKSESSVNAIVNHLVNKGYLIKRIGWRGLKLAKNEVGNE